jgi:hypothetical protein
MATDESALEPATRALPGRRLATWVLVALLVVGVAGLYQDASRKYPYYFIWDMDLSTAIDTALINSGRTPDHICHTGFGMYLLVKWATQAGKRLGLLSVADLDDVFRSLNPVACMAELTDYVRRMSPWVALGAVLCLWGAACRMFRLGPLASVAALVVLASQEPFLYHATMIRTALYSMLFWGAGLLALATAAHRRRELFRLIWLFVAGIMLGLSYATKLQAMVCVAMAALIFLLGLTRREDRPGTEDQPKREDEPADSDQLDAGNQADVGDELPAEAGPDMADCLDADPEPPAEDQPDAGNGPDTECEPDTGRQPLGPGPELTAWQCRTTVVLSFVNLAMFVALLIMSSRVEIPRGKAVFTGEFGMTKHTALLLALSIALCGAQVILWLRKRASSRWFSLAARLTVLMSGGLASFGLHLLMFDSLSVSSEYLLWDFKILFLRPLYTDFKGLWLYCENTWKIICFHPALFVVHFSSLALLGMAAFRRKAPAARRQFWLCAALSAMAILNTAICTRFQHKDLIWCELPMTFLAIGYCAKVLSSGAGRRALRVAACSCLLGALVVANVLHLGRTIPFVDSNLHRYGWSAGRWLDKVYSHNQVEYARMMFDHHTRRGEPPSEVLRALLRQAARHAEARRIASFVFRNQAIGMPHIGVAWEYAPVWTEDLNCRIVSLPDMLRDAIVVDAGSVPMGRRGFLAEEEPQRFGEDLSAHAPDESEPSMAILPRTDLDVFLFLQEQDYDALAHGTPEAGRAKPPRIEVSDGGQVMALQGLHLPVYRVIPASKIKGRFFFVVIPPLPR